MPHSTLRSDAIEIWKAGVAAVHGRTLVENAFRLDGNLLHVNESEFNLESFDRILVVGGGKFSHYMAEGIEHILGEELARAKQLSGLITVPDRSNEQVQLQHIEAAECRPAGVNLPTRRVVDATERMLALLEETDDRTLVLALISGGGSALIESSALQLEDIIAATNWLSKRGANILELNTVRIAISNVKGGGLAKAMPAGTMVSLIVSDVPNDDIRFVSSGPTVDFGSSDYAAAQNVISRFDTEEESGFPQSVVDHLQTTPVENELRCDLQNFLIGNASNASQAAVGKAKQLGYEIDNDVLAATENCDQIAKVASEWLREKTGGPKAVISLGEPVVDLGDSAGQGGRNQHCILATTNRLLSNQPEHDFCFLSAGTDGEDGNTTVAGALVSHLDVQNLATRQTEIESSLRCFNSHPFLAANGMLFESGPTATNVADLRVLLRSPS